MITGQHLLRHSLIWAFWVAPDKGQGLIARKDPGERWPSLQSHQIPLHPDASPHATRFENYPKLAATLVAADGRFWNSQRVVDRPEWGAKHIAGPHADLNLERRVLDLPARN